MRRAALLAAAGALCAACTSADARSPAPAERRSDSSPSNSSALLWPNLPYCDNIAVDCPILASVNICYNPCTYTFTGVPGTGGGPITRPTIADSGLVRCSFSTLKCGDGTQLQGCFVIQAGGSPVDLNGAGESCGLGGASGSGSSAGTGAGAGAGAGGSGTVGALPPLVSLPGQSQQEGAAVPSGSPLTAPPPVPSGSQAASAASATDSVAGAGAGAGAAQTSAPQTSSAAASSAPGASASSATAQAAVAGKNGAGVLRARVGALVALLCGAAGGALALAL